MPESARARPGPDLAYTAYSSTDSPMVTAVRTTPVVIVDGHQLVGSCLAASLRTNGHDARFHPVVSAIGVLVSLGQVRDGVVLLELDLGRDTTGAGIDGVGLVAPLSAAGWRVVLLTGHTRSERIGAALHAGGYGWIPKTAPLRTLVDALDQAIAGAEISSLPSRDQLIACHLRREHDRGDLGLRWSKLTDREREVLALLAAGNRAQAIAARFIVAPATVRTQIRAILTKLEVNSQIEAVALYQRARRP